LRDDDDLKPSNPQNNKGGHVQQGLRAEDMAADGGGGWGKKIKSNLQRYRWEPWPPLKRVHEEIFAREEKSQALLNHVSWALSV